MVRGYRRIFDHVGVIFIEKGLVSAVRRCATVATAEKRGHDTDTDAGRRA